MKEIVADTTPNGHFKRKIQITLKEYKKFLAFDNGCVRVDSGFNKFVEREGVLYIGYNHHNTLKKKLHLREKDERNV
jgi:hypothetical protein